MEHRLSPAARLNVDDHGRLARLPAAPHRRGFFSAVPMLAASALSRPVVALAG